MTFCNIEITARLLHCIICHEFCAVLPASCTFSTALVISAFKASVSSADTEVVTGTTANTRQNKEFLFYLQEYGGTGNNAKKTLKVFTDLSAGQLYRLPGW